MVRAQLSQIGLYQLALAWPISRRGGFGRWRAAALLLAAAVTVCASAEPPAISSFYVMRHLNRTAEGDSLNATGFANACRLARWFADRSLAAIHTSRFERAAQTAGPTGRHRGLPVQRFSTTSQGIAAIKAAPRPVLVVANTRTVQRIVAELGGVPPNVEPTGFGQIWVIDSTGRTTMTNLPTNGPGCSGAAGGTFRE